MLVSHTWSDNLTYLYLSMNNQQFQSNQLTIGKRHEKHVYIRHDKY